MLTHLIEYLESTAGTLPIQFTRKPDIQANVAQDQPSVYHKVQGDSVAKRSSGAWGSRGTHFRNGMDRQQLTLDREHVTPHALRPGLLHTAEEAACDHRPEQIHAVTAHGFEPSHSGITRALQEFSASWFQGRLYRHAFLLLYSDTQKHGQHHKGVPGVHSAVWDSFDMVIQGYPYASYSVFGLRGLWKELGGILDLRFTFFTIVSVNARFFNSLLPY